MVINTNLAGTGGTPLAKPANRPGSSSKIMNPSENSSAMVGAMTLNSQTDRLLASSGADIEDANAARESAQFTRTNILHQPATAMLAQANLSPETVFNLLQE